MIRWLLALTLLFAVSAAPVASAPVWAASEPAPFCAPDEAPHFAFGIAALHDAIGPIMGDALECEHPNSANGDTLQQTTTGLAMYRQSSNTPEFTDGWNHWALTTSGILAWSGGDVTAAGVDATPPPASSASSGTASSAPSTTAPSATSAPARQCVDVSAGVCLNATQDVAGTVVLLSHSSAAQPLLQTAARASYTVHSGELPLDVLGLFRPSRHEIVLSSVLAQYPEIDRGPVLAHELQHVSDWIDQGAALESLKGCLATETNAFHTEAAVWLELEGGHLPKPANDLERELNMISHAITVDPEGFASRLTIAYHDQCTPA